jgi:hypothetical protein
MTVKIMMSDLSNSVREEMIRAAAHHQEKRSTDCAEFIHFFSICVICESVDGFEGANYV